MSVDQLDSMFTHDGVLKAVLNMLKNGKKGGKDGLCWCLLIVYPDTWTKSIIVPVPEKYDLDYVNNYRGITLSSIFAYFIS